ncbi:MMPL family transporter [Bacillus sp. B1-b2]|uniref:MMPL family transporter n=1 Tax=Bacillus sp. B1-b2 TaxID=2653201 RepID=UPI001261F2B4|nr:MMPL family transporter [Bacillus sp. B1-b2]KAB7666079.1 MMPL family transporter [Bacillus sp. B1-b2]
MKNFIHRYFAFVSSKKGKWVTLIAWILIIGTLSLTLPQASSQKNDQAQAIPSDAPSQQAEELLNKEFPNEQGTPALITWYRSTGLTDNDLSQIQELTNQLSENPLKNQQSVIPFYEMPLQVVKQQISEDGTTLVLPILFESGTETGVLEESIQKLEKTTDSIFSQNPFSTDLENKDVLQARTTGPVGIAIDASSLFSQGDLSLLIGTVIIVLICLLVIYRSPILALIPLIGVGIAYGVTSPVLGAMGKAGWIEFDSQSIAIMTVLLFGAGTDYCLFIISRYRSYLTQEPLKEIAMKRALNRSGGAVAMSGLTVVFSLLILLFAQYGSVHRFAIPFSLSILIMMAASLSLVPAILAILGRFSFFPFVPKTEAMGKRKSSEQKNRRKQTFGQLIGTTVTKHPWQVTIITTIFLAFFAFFATKTVYTYDLLSSFPEDMPSREGFSLIEEHFSAGELAPLSIMIDTEGKDIPIEEALMNLDFISTVSAPEIAKNNEELVKYSVELNTNPYSNQAMDEIPIIKEKLQDELEKAGLKDENTNIWLSGITAEQYDTRDITKHDENIVIPLIIILIAILLLAYLRSITATIYLIATVLLSYFSALGLGWIILHYLFGVEAIQGLIPLYSFVFIVALGEDYNIFMISSIWKKSKEIPLLQAIKEGVAESGGVITSAGVILAATFMVLTTLPMQILVHFGTITAIGVLLDTFVVRPFLVPSITTLLGKKAFWPAKRSELHSVETTQMEREH